MSNSEYQTPPSPPSQLSPLAPGALSTDTVDALRRALRARLGRPEQRDDELRRAVRLMCDELRARGLHAEQLLVAVKELWQSLPEAQQLPFGPPRYDALDHIITMCIQEFYDPRPPTRHQ